MDGGAHASVYQGPTLCFALARSALRRANVRAVRNLSLSLSLSLTLTLTLTLILTLTLTLGTACSAP